MVTYDWKDYKHEAVHKEMTMHAVEFLHLFSLHILPPAFVRIRHYGLLSPSNREKVRKEQKQLGGTPVPKVRRKKSSADLRGKGMGDWHLSALQVSHASN